METIVVIDNQTGQKKEYQIDFKDGNKKNFRDSYNYTRNICCAFLILILIVSTLISLFLISKALLSLKSFNDLIKSLRHTDIRLLSYILIAFFGVQITALICITLFLIKDNYHIRIEKLRLLNKSYEENSKLFQNQEQEFEKNIETGITQLCSKEIIKKQNLRYEIIKQYENSILEV